MMIFELTHFKRLSLWFMHLNLEAAADIVRLIEQQSVHHREFHLVKASIIFLPKAPASDWTPTVCLGQQKSGISRVFIEHGVELWSVISVESKHTNWIS